jgi:hypothetical protein
MAKRNQYRAWSGDHKALSQMTYRPPTIWQECKNCHQQFPLEPSQHMWVHEITDLRGGLCPTCIERQEQI